MLPLAAARGVRAVAVGSARALGRGAGAVAAAATARRRGGRGLGCRPAATWRRRRCASSPPTCGSSISRARTSWSPSCGRSGAAARSSSTGCGPGFAQLEVNLAPGILDALSWATMAGAVLTVVALVVHRRRACAAGCRSSVSWSSRWRRCSSRLHVAAWRDLPRFGDPVITGPLPDAAAPARGAEHRGDRAARCRGGSGPRPPRSSSGSRRCSPCRPSAPRWCGSMSDRRGAVPALIAGLLVARLRPSCSTVGVGPREPAVHRRGAPAAGADRGHGRAGAGRRARVPGRASRSRPTASRRCSGSARAGSPACR